MSRLRLRERLRKAFHATSLLRRAGVRTQCGSDSAESLESLLQVGDETIRQKPKAARALEVIEILECILLQVYLRSGGSSALTRCMLVCQEWQEIGQHLLRTHPIIRVSQFETFDAELFAEVKAENPLVSVPRKEKRRFVHYQPPPPTSPSNQLAAGTNYKLTSIRSLSLIIGPEPGLRHSGLRQLLYRFGHDVMHGLSQLQSLSIHINYVQPDIAYPPYYLGPSCWRESGSYYVQELIRHIPSSVENLDLHLRGDLFWSNKYRGHQHGPCASIQQLLPQLKYLRLSPGCLCTTLWRSDKEAQNKFTTSPQPLQLHTLIINTLSFKDRIIHPRLYKRLETHVSPNPFPSLLWQDGREETVTTIRNDRINKTQDLVLSNHHLSLEKRWKRNIRHAARFFAENRTFFPNLTTFRIIREDTIQEDARNDLKPYMSDNHIDNTAAVLVDDDDVSPHCGIDGELRQVEFGLTTVREKCISIYDFVVGTGGCEGESMTMTPKVTHYVPVRCDRVDRTDPQEDKVKKR